LFFSPLGAFDPDPYKIKKGGAGLLAIIEEGMPEPARMADTAAS